MCDNLRPLCLPCEMNYLSLVEAHIYSLVGRDVVLVSETPIIQNSNQWDCARAWNCTREGTVGEHGRASADLVQFFKLKNTTSHRSGFWNPVLLPCSLLQHLRSSEGFLSACVVLRHIRRNTVQPRSCVYSLRRDNPATTPRTPIRRCARTATGKTGRDSSPVFRRSSFTYLFSTYFYYSTDILFMDHRKQFILRQINSAALSYCWL